MPLVYLTRIEKFNAAHKLWVNAWSEEKNIDTFGKCANKNWHGHNYKLEVTVMGEPDPYTGFVIDAKVLAQIIRRTVTDIVDHSNLNLDIPFLPHGMQPTTENMAVLFWQQIAPELVGCSLFRIRLHETDTIFAEYYGE